MKRTPLLLLSVLILSCNSPKYKWMKIQDELEDFKNKTNFVSYNEIKVKASQIDSLIKELSLMHPSWREQDILSSRNNLNRLISVKVVSTKNLK